MLQATGLYLFLCFFVFFCFSFFPLFFLCIFLSWLNKHNVAFWLELGVFRQVLLHSAVIWSVCWSDLWLFLSHCEEDSEGCFKTVAMLRYFIWQTKTAEDCQASLWLYESTPLKVLWAWGHQGMFSVDSVWKHSWVSDPLQMMIRPSLVIHT